MQSRFSSLVCAMVLMALPAFAQTPTGSIAGRVASSDGQPLPGVTIAATSPNLQGTREVVSTDSGDFLIPLLPPGDYTVTFTLSGFQTLTTRVGVAGTQVVSLNETMAVSGVTEQVNVVGRAETFTQTATVATKFRQDLITALPTSRNLDATVLMAPGVLATGPNGNSYSIGGSMSFESLFAVNGVVITENLRGTPYTLYIEDALQETTVATSGISAEFGRFGGGLVNAITKSGGNTFNGSYRHSLNNDSWRSQTPSKETKLDKLVPTYEYTFGGPVVIDRLWFFTAGRLQQQEESRNLAVVNQPYTRINDEKRYEFKGTYSPVTNHTAKVSYTKIDQQVTNLAFQNIMDTRSLYNQGQPQDLLAAHYAAVVKPNFFLEGQFSQRVFTFSGAGATSTDLIDGTLLIDRSRGGTSFRYWAATFCGVCDDEERSNTDILVKGSYFLSTGRGSHNMIFGVDSYNDHRFSNNHQSGSDYRILGTSTIVQGSDIIPVFLPGSTIIQWNPISLSSQGTDLRTTSFFVNDQWRYNNQLTLNLGLRYDTNQGEDAAGNTVSDSKVLSPRLSVVFDPRGDGVWSTSGSYARYAAALNTGVADVSAGGNPATYQWPYQGPAINGSGATSTTPQAIRQLFDWFFANGGTNRPFSLVDIPGVATKIGGSLKSPTVDEVAFGVSRQLGGRGSVRADFSYRTYGNFYATRTDRSTGSVTDSVGRTFDLGLIENTDVIERQYRGATFSATYRVGSRLDLGGNYTLSKTTGNFDGETAASGPVTTEVLSYPEYLDLSWNAPVGALSVDQRHRMRLWGTYDVPLPSGFGTATLGVVQQFGSGVPYGAVGAVDTTPYVTGTSYLNPSGGRADGFWDYYFTDRDAFRTEASHRTDVALNYAYRVPGGSRLELFFRGEVLNVWNQFQLCGCGGTVFGNGGGSDLRKVNQGILTATNSTTLQPFNPFTTTPVEGVHWAKRPNFGTQVDRFSWTTPRTFRMSVGLRF